MSLISVGVFIHWLAEDDKKIQEYNYQATKESIERLKKSFETFNVNIEKFNLWDELTEIEQAMEDELRAIWNDGEDLYEDVIREVASSDCIRADSAEECMVYVGSRVGKYVYNEVGELVDELGLAYDSVESRANEM